MIDIPIQYVCFYRTLKNIVESYPSDSQEELTAKINTVIKTEYNDALVLAPEFMQEMRKNWRSGFIPFEEDLSESNWKKSVCAQQREQEMHEKTIESWKTASTPEVSVSEKKGFWNSVKKAFK